MIDLTKIRFVLVETSHGGNIGAAARAMKTMGLSDLALVRPCRFKTYECYARASGADGILDNALVCDSLSDAVSDCSQVIGTSARLRSLRWPEYSPREMGDVIRTTGNDATVAIVFGRERSGLTNEELEQCSSLVVIPAESDFSSLNIAAAVQVLAYEMRVALCADSVQESISLTTGASPLGSSTSDPPVDVVTTPEQPATHADLDGMYRHLESTMANIGYLNPENPRMMMTRFRRLFNRAGLAKNEVQMLRGLAAALDKAARRQTSQIKRLHSNNSS